ncbi:hypothetical protein R3P38DRAFT_2849942 [Favolaschia claudopus]|uniref:Uncharacterized protein n=1 Tax=Favolaschia claudopus TaxID=2862362 RepID=A0AAW0DWZ0_9AGAR
MAFYAVRMPQNVGVVGHGHKHVSGIAAGAGTEPGVVAPENASAGFTEYVPPPRAAEASEAEGAGAGLSY